MRRTLCTLAAIAGAAAQASATWSIVLIDTRTGEVALGSATCLTNFDLQAGTPVLIPGYGGATAQSFVDQGGFNRVFIRDRLLERVHPDDILTMLESFDSGHQTRQYGIADTLGGVATFTGTGAGEWAGGATGQVGDVVYAVQGNVLAGDPVVFETEQVIVTALQGGLDLAGAMMLGMEEARVWGGDGRCSCGNDADACGSPPDGWDPETGKSAHIAYMLIARAGDGFGCNSVYRTGAGSWGVVQGDFDEDGRLDIVSAAELDTNFAFLSNTRYVPGFATFAPPVFSPAVSGPTDLVAADFDKDGHLDIFYADKGANLVAILPGAGDGTFGTAQFDIVPAGPIWAATADLNNDTWPDAVVSSPDAGVLTVLLNDGAGNLSTQAQLPAGTSPFTVITAEIDGNPGIDIACVDRTDDQVYIFSNDGSGDFSLWLQIPTENNPLGLTAGDFDGDGNTDLATANRQSSTLNVLRQTAPGVFEAATVGGFASYTTVAAADINNDGLDDIIATLASPARFTLLLGQPGDLPEVERSYAGGSNTNDITIADFNGDGWPDLVHNIRQARGVMAIPGIDPALGNGYFNDGEGCATADYYMEFNVAFQSRDAPDPVAQLHDLFDQWRTDLIGVPDAVRTIAVPDADRIPAGASTVIRFEAFDWEQMPVGPGLTVAAAHAPDSAGLTRFGDAIDNGDGTYAVPVLGDHLSGDARGIDVVEIRITQGDTQVILMPSPTIVITGPLADWNGDGQVDTTDLLAFLNDWNADDPAADINEDGVIDTRDAVAYLRAWAGN